MAALAHLDLRDHIPNQLEVHLGDAHAGITPGAGDGERHVRFRFTTEVHRPIIDLVRHGLHELRIVGKIGAAADHVHRQPRNPQPLLAAGVDLRQLGNGGHLPQQPQRIEAALLDRAGRPGQLRRPAELALNLLDELSDLGGGGFRLFALNADEGNLVLLVVEVDVENTVRQERDADHRHEQRNVLGKQASAGFRSGSLGRRLRLLTVCREPRAFRSKALHEIANPHPHHCSKIARTRVP